MRDLMERMGKRGENMAELEDRISGIEFHSPLSSCPYLTTD
jgi:hypothetical protein